MLQTFLFPFRLLYYIVLTFFRIIGFFFRTGVRSTRFMAGGLFAVAIGVIIGLFIGRKIDAGKLLAELKDIKNGPRR